MSAVLAVPYGSIGDMSKKSPLSISVQRLVPTPGTGPLTNTVTYNEAKKYMPVRSTTHPHAHDFHHLPRLQDMQGVKHREVRDSVFGKWENTSLPRGCTLDAALSKVNQLNSEAPAHDKKNQILKIKIRFTDSSEITFSRANPQSAASLRFEKFYSPNQAFDEAVVKSGSTIGKRPNVGYQIPPLVKPDGRLTMPDSQSRHQLFGRLDGNRSGKLSLAELDKGVVELWPQFNNKPAIMRAYKAADMNGGGYICRSEFEFFLKYLVNYTRVYLTFRRYDTSADGRVGPLEFKEAARKSDPSKSDAELEADFRKIDKNGGGMVLFEEFVDYIAARHTNLELRPAVADLERSRARTAKAAEVRAQQAAAATKSAAASRRIQPIVLPNDAARDKLFSRLDPNGNGLLSLAELDKGIIELWPRFDNKPAIMRAYKAADVNGTGFIGKKEFEYFLRFIVHYNNLFALFSELDTGGDRRISETEFISAAAKIGVSGEAEARIAFRAMDKNRGGQVLFGEFAEWVAKNRAAYEMPKVPRRATPQPGGVRASRTPTPQTPQVQRPKRLEPVTVPSRDAMKKLFSRLDPNGNGLLSLAELDKGIIELWPRFDNKPAIMRAYKAADTSKNGLIGRREFEYFLRHLVHYNNLWAQFASIDTSDDRRVSRKEFLDGAAILDLGYGDSQLLELFDRMDRNQGGFVLFREFCTVLADLKANSEMSS